MAESGAASNGTRHGGCVDVAEAVLFMADVALFLEDAELGTHGGIAGLVRKTSENLADRGALELVEDIHDLAFAARQGVRFRLVGHRLRIGSLLLL